MMKKTLSILSLIAIQTLVCGQTKMAESDVLKFKNKVTTESKSLQSLSADFVQTKHISFLSKPITSAGKLNLKNDEKLRWEYVTPTKYTVIFKDKKLMVNNQGKQTTVDLAANKQFEKLSKLISGSINGNMFDDKEFSIAYLQTDTDYLVKLTPKAKDLAKYIKEIELYFEKNGQLVHQTKMIEPNNDFTLITFSNKKINQPIHDSVFNL